MNITFLIGNGFDINLGLRTTFKEFVTHYRSNTENDSPLIKEFKKIISENEPLWSNAEIEFGRYTSYFNGVTRTATDFYTCYDDFCKALAEYLDDEENKLYYESLKDELNDRFGKAIMNFYSGFRENQQQRIMEAMSQMNGEITFNFIVFNYTTTVDECVATVKRRPAVLGNRVIGNIAHDNKIGKIIHVHGCTCKDMVLGVNDESQIANKALFSGLEEEYINQMIKVKANELNEENTDQKAHSILQSSDIIYIYGMALGQTDALWWKRIYKIMNTKGTVHLIIHSHNAPERTLNSREFQIYAKKKRKEFVSFGEPSGSVKEGIMERIHIDGSNIFSRLTNIIDDKKNVELVQNAV